ncbi:MAG: hypothetical protein KAQ75_16970 [Bacteroidales bacterium]|nr:hypothetical protein [Bacteroidales bacterium]
MSQWYRDLDKKFSWSFFGFLIGILGLGFGLYAYYHKDKPNIEFEVLTNTEVFNINENIGKLKILYNNENVLSIDTTLKLLTIKFINSGNSSIKKEDFDDDYRVKLIIDNFIIADKPSIIHYSNLYLKEKFKFRYDYNSIEISPIIFDAHDYVIFKILLIGASKDTPSMKSIGKVAGQKHIPVITEMKDKDKTTLWDIVIGILLIIGVLIIIGVLGVLFEELRNKLILIRKNKIIKRFTNYYKIEIDQFYEQIFAIYREYDRNVLSYIIEISKDLEKFEKFITISHEAKSLKYIDLYYIGIDLHSGIKMSDNFEEISVIEELISNEDITENKNSKIKIKDKFIEEIEKLLKFIKK